MIVPHQVVEYIRTTRAVQTGRQESIGPVGHPGSDHPDGGAVYTIYRDTTF